jgi:hypothetical protein
MSSETFDVFLSHNSNDKGEVEKLAVRLRGDGVRVWLDKWNLVPGEHWQEKIEQALAASSSCAVFVGGDGISPWHNLEMRAAISQQVSAPRPFRVIPVLLPNAAQPRQDKLPAFLREVTWVQFKDAVDGEAYRRLVCGIRGEAPGFTPSAAEPAAGDDRRLKIVPHGLRSFDVDDSRFFLRLLPGPRDHRDLPTSIAFWKDRLEQIDDQRTFRVGLLYGPSGCGKSSLVKAGLLPRLAEYVKPIYVEATPADTERQLLARLRGEFPELPGELELPAAVRHMCEQPQTLEGRKAVLILDQFEQWLHANRLRDDNPLVVALRECDARHVQCVLMVRDDFFLGIHRFMSAVGVPIRQDVNMALVDLFDPPHARRVLAEFGRAYDCLPDDVKQLSDEQCAFLDRVVAGLADHDGKLVSVQLALFADMVQGKPWTADTLQQIGGAAGVGLTFLEENFDRRTSNPVHRVHRSAAMAILKALLPEPGADIKGAMKSRAELQKAAGYDDRDRDFAELLQILLDELRVVSPTATDEAGESPADPAADGRCYQLTHDYLVPSLRQWLTARQKETWRGRALLRLEERTAQWRREPQTRYLPNLLEYVSISLGVPRGKRTHRISGK